MRDGFCQIHYSFECNLLIKDNVLMDNSKANRKDRMQQLTNKSEVWNEKQDLRNGGDVEK